MVCLQNLRKICQGGEMETFKMILLHDILPMVHGKMVYFQRKGIFWGKQNWEKLMMKLGKHLIWHIQQDGRYSLKCFSLD